MAVIYKVDKDSKEKKDIVYSQRNIGQRLKELRNSLGYTQRELAVLLKIKQHNLTRWETGSVRIPQKVLFMIAIKCCSVDWLLTGEGVMQIKKEVMKWHHHLQ